MPRRRTVDSPLGPLRSRAPTTASPALWFDGQKRPPRRARLRRERPDDPLLRARCGAARRLLRRPRTRFDLPLDLHGTRVPARACGRRCSRIAVGAHHAATARSRAAVGAPRAVRAVGAAIGRNPVSIIVPCHRVIGSDGALTGYAGGLERKRALLGSKASPPLASQARHEADDLASCVALAALWGASFLFMRMGAAEFGPVALAAVRVAGAALFLLPLLLCARAGARRCGALAADLRRRRAQLGAAVPLLQLRGAVDHRRAVVDLQRDDAAVRRGDRLAVAARPPDAAARRSASRSASPACSWLAWSNVTRRASSPAAAAGRSWPASPRRCAMASRRTSRSATCRRRRRSRSPPAARSAATLVLAVPRCCGGRTADAVADGVGRGAAARRLVHRPRLHPVLPADRARRAGQRDHGDVPDPGVRRAVGLDVPRRAITAAMVVGCAVILLGTALTTGLLKLPERRLADGPPPKRLRRSPSKGAPLADQQSRIRGGRLVA